MLQTKTFEEDCKIKLYSLVFADHWSNAVAKIRQLIRLIFVKNNLKGTNINEDQVSIIVSVL